MRYPCFALFVFFVCKFPAQNLVPNPSFESYSECPVMITQDRLLGLNDWYQPTRGSADYYNRCSKKVCGVPRNLLGYMQPRTGNGYVGIITYLKEKGKKDYREYLEAQLSDRLIKDHQYCVQVHIALARSSLYATSNFDILFSRFVVKSDNDKCLEEIPQLHYQDSLQMSGEQSWKEIKWIYTAEGGERFMVIGNLQKDKKTPATKLPKAETAYDPANPTSLQYPEAYYYLDDVSVTDITATGKCEWDFVPKPVATDTLVSHVPAAPAFELNKKLVLKNIYFDTDHATLLAASDAELDKLYDFLAAHGSLHAVITGHTDNQGTAEHNRLLSLARAKAVMEYLTSKGIAEERLLPAGMGQTQPIAANDTEEGRQLNRRVEILLIEKRY
jgi:OOP family OmpA-OmpF porin